MPVQYSRIVAALAVVAVIVLPGAGSAMAQTHSRIAQATPKGEPRSSAAEAPPSDNQGEIAELRRRLNISAAQQPQFDALAKVMRQNEEEMTKLAAQQSQRGKANAVEAVRSAQQFAQAEAEGLGRMLPALETLYGTLSEQQKRAADQVFASGPEQEQAPAPAPKRR